MLSARPHVDAAGGDGGQELTRAAVLEIQDAVLGTAASSKDTRPTERKVCHISLSLSLSLALLAIRLRDRVIEWSDGRVESINNRSAFEIGE